MTRLLVIDETLLVEIVVIEDLDYFLVQQNLLFFLNTCVRGNSCSSEWM